MCGISGLCDFTSSSSPEQLRKMGHAIRHRGPDDEGLEWFDLGGTQTGLCHQRLSILDLSTKGHQPMFSTSRKLVITFNGEIYNFREIRSELEQQGCRFVSNSDTEVILCAFEKWGKAAVHKFIGMFAFAILDLQKEKLLLVRDRAGVKPLYYYRNKDLFLFASELKAFHAHPGFGKKINRNALGLYLQYGYVPAPLSVFEDAFKVKAGHFLELDLRTKKISEEKYWDIHHFYQESRLRITLADAVNETEKLLHNAFQYRMVSDVPVGIFLSGGYDSSAVAAILQKDSAEKLKTFTIGFHEPEWNEAHFAKKIAKHLGTDHHELICSNEDAMHVLNDIPALLDEPHADQSVIPTALVSRLARGQVKVALSADGGDETFAGYSRYVSLLQNFEKWTQRPGLLKLLAGKFLIPAGMVKDPGTKKELLNAVQRHSIGSYAATAAKYFSQDEIKKLLNISCDPGATFFSPQQVLSTGDYLNDLLALDYKTYLADNCLAKVDRCTMSVGLEGREPLLDHRISEFAAQLPGNFKIREGTQKYILKEIVHRYLPKEMMARPKMGFSIPVSKWLLQEWKPLADELLDDKTIAREGIFSPAEVKKLVKDFYRTREPRLGQKTWNIVLFRLWNRHWGQ